MTDDRTSTTEAQLIEQQRPCNPRGSASETLARALGTAPPPTPDTPPRHTAADRPH